MRPTQKQRIIRGYCLFVIGALTIFLLGLVVHTYITTNPVVGFAQGTNQASAIDLDGDGIPNEVEQNCQPDTCDIDNDGNENYRDSDSDNDGLLDTVERGSTCAVITNCEPVDSDNDGLPDYLQSTRAVLPRSGATQLFVIVIMIIVSLTTYVIYSESRGNNMKIK
jgi:hypothetical protein